MPRKQKKSKELVHKAFTNGSIILRLSDNFIYKVEIRKYTSTSFNLEDSRYVASKTYMQDKIESVTKADGTTFKKSVELVGAPYGWLMNNKFTEICQD